MARLLTRQLCTAPGGALRGTYDVVVVGAGMVGSMLAQLLRTNALTAHLRVALVNQAPLPAGIPPLSAVPGLRVSTLTPQSLELARQAGVGPLVDDEALAAPVRHMQVWDEGGSGYISYEAASVGRASMAVVVENAALQEHLLQQLRSGATQLLSPVSLLSAQLPPYGDEAAKRGAPLAGLRLSGGHHDLRARLVVGADGPGSQVRQLAGLRTFGLDYQQRAVVATLQSAGAAPAATSAPAACTAWQRFMGSGPIACLPVRGGCHNIIWSTSPGHARALEQLSGAGFADAVNEAFQGGATPSRNPFLAPGRAQPFRTPPSLGQCLAAPRHASFPLRLQSSGRYVRPRVALVGDAAHVVHPLAGQGVNLGFADAGALVETLARGVQQGRDLGDLSLLEEYEAKRQLANGAMLAAIDGLKRVFAPQAGLLAGLRGLGLDLLNASPVLKQRIMGVAMGLA